MRSDYGARAVAWLVLGMFGVVPGEPAAYADAPGTYRVSGIAPDTVLNVRARPSVAAEDIGDLPADAAPLEVLELAADGNWGRILWRDASGWIALRYLAPLAVPRFANTALPRDLRCAGTEPFWSLELSTPDAMRLSVPGAGEPLAYTVSATAPALQGGGFPVAVEARAGAQALTAIIRPAQCQDGMSERRYGWTAELLRRDSDGLVLLAGCCTLPIRIR